MGKIRVKALGDEEQEKKDKKKVEAKKLADAAKKAAAERVAAESDQTPKTASTEENSEATTDKKKKKKEKFKKIKKQPRSANYLKLAEKVDKKKVYKLQDALTLLPTIKLTDFDETVELHMNTVDKGLSGAVTLPHGTGKKVRVVVANQSTDPKGVEELVKKVEGGTIDFDILIATPDSMPKLAKVARILGPRGLMPNPKNGTVTPKPDEIAKKFEGGQMNYKTEAKFPIMHLSVGKVSFGEKKLAENIKAAIEAIKAKNIKTATLKSTMSPGLKIDVASL